MVSQAALRSNPSLEFERKEQLGGGDNTSMISGMLPLELGGRRQARILVAQKELELKEQLLANSERLLAADVRAKFGIALAEMLKLGFTEDLLASTDRGYRLVAAKVKEGRTPPLEENMVLVEVNRIRSARETSEGKVEIALLDLRNVMGMKPEEPLRLRGDFDHLIDPLPLPAVATEDALRTRPDVLAARANEGLAAAQIDQARAFAGDLDRNYPDYLPAKLMQVQITLAGGDAKTALQLSSQLQDRLAKATPDRNTSPLPWDIFFGFCIHGPRTWPGGRCPCG